jgi:hypothetical protein
MNHWRPRRLPSSESLPWGCGSWQDDRFLNQPYFAKKSSFWTIPENGNISVIRKSGEFGENGAMRRFYRLD